MRARIGLDATGERDEQQPKTYSGMKESSGREQRGGAKVTGNTDR